MPGLEEGLRRWECSFLGIELECAHFNLGWGFMNRLCADLALPLPMLVDGSESGPKLVMGPDFAEGRYTWEERSRFDLDVGEPWWYLIEFGSRTLATDQCRPSSYLGEHGDLWSEGHSLTVSWDFPWLCSAEGSDGSVKSEKVRA